MIDQIGKPITVSCDRDYSLNFGTLRLLIRRRAGEWHFASHRSSGDFQPFSMEEMESTEGEEWERWITGDDGNQIILRPVFS